MTKRDRRNGLDLELRIVMNGAIVIGPVQAALLEAICNTGSIAAAQRRLGSSYAHVWKLVAAMNATFFPPLVDPIRGGSRGGGAILTRQGHTVLTAFRHLERLARVQGGVELLVTGKAASHAAAKSPAAHGSS